jgi:hypothetical protein
LFSRLTAIRSSPPEDDAAAARFDVTDCGRRTRRADRRCRDEFRRAVADYLRAMDIPLIRGGLSRRDGPASLRVRDQPDRCRRLFMIKIGRRVRFSNGAPDAW